MTRTGRSLPNQVGLVALAGWIALSCASTRSGSSAEPRLDPPATILEPVEIPPGSGQITEFLGCEAPDGSSRYSTIKRRDMPWRVAIGTPQVSPRMGSRREARDAAITAMRSWERAIQTRVDWFELEFVDRDEDAPVQIEWKRRITGTAQGRAGPECRFDGDAIRVGGRMEAAVRSCPTCATLTLDQVRALFAHEFGHILGLGHCLNCDSAMNYSWHSRDRIFVTRTDVEAVVHLLDRANAGAADAENVRRFALHGEVVAYDEERRVLEFRVAATDVRRASRTFSRLAVRGRVPGEIERGSVHPFAVQPDGIVLHRTVIRSIEGRGIGTKGTSAGFKEAVSRLPSNRPMMMTLEDNDITAVEGGAPRYRIMTIQLDYTDKELAELIDRFWVEEE